jgi:L-alanine-DL-glutamate epimerase-like enolase superfamily enzyme
MQIKLSLSPLPLSLRVNWKLSRGGATEKNNFLFSVATTDAQGLGEIAPNLRYGESTEVIQGDFARLSSQRWELDSLRAFLETNPPGYSHSFLCGAHGAVLRLIGHKTHQQIWQLLKIPPPLSQVPTSFSLPIMPLEDVAPYLQQYGQFSSFKIKVDGPSAISLTLASYAATQRPLRIDANEGMPDLETFLAFDAATKHLPIEFIEQPFPAQRTDLYRQLKGKTARLIMADESIENTADFASLGEQFQAVNIKLMKAGALTTARDLLIAAKKAGLKTMIGCMIESGLGISLAMELSGLADFFDLDGNLLLKEDPFSLTREQGGNISRQE